MSNAIYKKNQLAKRRANRTRSNISGTAERPRLSVFRSSKHISVQAIDDISGKTLVSASDKDVKAESPVEVAKAVGADIAKKLIEANVKSVVFDRGSYKYHGRVKALADGAREGGLEF